VGHPRLALYLFVGTLVSIDVFFLDFVGYLQTGRFLFAEQPGEWILLPGWLLVVWIILRLRRLYESTIQNLPEQSDPDISAIETDRQTWTDDLLAWLGVSKTAADKEHANLESMYSRRLTVAILLAGWLFHFSWWVFDPAAGQTVTQIAGREVALAKFFGVYPIFYYPIGAEFVSLYIGIHALTPFKIRRARLIDFTDPHGFGGLQSVGNLLKHSTISYFLLLSLFASFLTLARGTGVTNPFNLSFIVGGSVFGIALFYAPVYWLHVHMSTAKNEKIDAIAREIRTAGTDDRMFPNTQADSTSTVLEYTHDHIRLTRVENTKEFPTNLSMIQKVMFSLVLPYFAWIVLDSLLVFFNLL